MKKLFILFALFAMVSCSNNRPSRTSQDTIIEVAENDVVSSTNVLVETENNNIKIEPFIKLIDRIYISKLGHVAVIEIGGNQYIVTDAEGGIKEVAN